MAHTIAVFFLTFQVAMAAGDIIWELIAAHHGIPAAPFAAAT